MKRAIGKRFGPYRVVAATAVFAALAACEEGFQPFASPDAEAESDTSTTGETIELFPDSANGSQKDVQAPEVFSLTEAGLWDGRPSLGGVWVAHPNVDQPERVLITNTANNKSVTGALFRRDVNLPGPALQISSTAAEELGMLAGSPTRVEVVALRRETVAPPPAAAPAPEDTPETVDEEPAAEAEVETAAVETEEQPAKRKWWQKKKPTEEANTAGAVAAGAAAGAAVAASAADDAASVAEDTASVAEDTASAVADTTAEAASQTASLTDPEVTPPVEKPAKRRWWQKKDPNEITETPLDPIAGAAAAIEASEPSVAPAAAATATAAATTSAVSSLSKPYVQAGTFSVEANANSAAEKIRRNGMTAEVRELQSEGNPVWRVLVGPAQTRAERKAILSDVRDIGFSDAFTASN